MIADEVDCAGIETLSSRPGDPVCDRGDQVVGDEAVEEGRVHLVDAVLRRIVDCREDQGLRVEAHAFDFTIKDKLKRRVLDARACTVDLIEEEDASLGACRVQPIGGSKGGDASVGDALVIGDADEVTFGEERQADIEEAHATCPSAFSGNGRLADAVGSTKQDCILQIGEDERESFEVDGV